MINFLNPEYLWGLWLVAVPLFIHLLNKRKVKNVPVASIRFLKRIEHKKIKNIKLKEWLLLIIRTMIILLTVLIFAEPIVVTSSHTSSSDNSFFVIKDRSHSMCYRTVEGIKGIEDAETAMAELVNELWDSGKLLKINGENYDGLYSITDNEKEKKKSADRYTDGLKLQNAAAVIRNHIKKYKSTNNYVILISDFQQRNDYTPLQVLSDEGIKNVFIPVRSKVENNVGITSVDFLSKIFTVGRDMHMKIKIKNFSSALQNRTYFVKINGRTILQKSFTLKGGEEKSFAVFYKIDEYGWNRGEVALQADELDNDNHYYYSYYVPERYKILVLTDKMATWWQDVLTPLVNRNSVKMKIVDSPKFLSINSADYDILLIQADFKPSEFIQTKLRKYAQDGGKSILLPFSAEGVFNDLLATLNISGFAGQRIAADSSFMAVLHDPVFPYSGTNRLTDPAKVYFNSFYILNRNKGKILLKFANGMPFLVKDGKFGNCLLFTADVSPQNGSFFLYPSFLPMIYDAIFYLSNSHAGESLLNLQRDGLIKKLMETLPEGEYNLRTPKGREMIIPVARKNRKWLMEYFNTPGFYEISGNNREQIVALNYDPEESDLEFLSNRELEKTYKGTIVDKNDMGKIKNMIIGSVRITNYLILFILALLLVEMSLSGNPWGTGGIFAGKK